MTDYPPLTLMFICEQCDEMFVEVDHGCPPIQEYTGKIVVGKVSYDEPNDEEDGW